MADISTKQMINYLSTASLETDQIAQTVDEMKLMAYNRRIHKMRQIAVRLFSKSRKFGEYLYKTIPSQVLFRKGVETKDETLEREENIVRTIWRHIELNRNILAF